MAIYHLHAQAISRGQGRSSVAAAAYRAACNLIETVIDKETGATFEIVHDYTHKQGVVYSRILAPENAPAWCYDRELLWNKIQNEFELRKDGRFCREIDLALPKELSEEQNIKLLTEFVNESFVAEGMVADLNFHNDNPENPHAHIMLSTREIAKGEDGNFTFGKKVTYWNTNEFLVHTRRMWAGFINKHLELAGIDQEVSHLSHAERGIDLRPTIKEGIARFVDGSERSEINQQIRAYNEDLVRGNPELIIDKNFRNKTVFTKEEVARELFNIYTSDEAFSLLAEDNLVVDGNKNSSSASAEADNQKSLSDYIISLDKVMSSDKIALLDARDMNGKKLYTTAKRLELEKSFLDIASALKEREQGHRIVLADKDLDKKSILEQASDLIDKAKEALGFDYDKFELSKQQRRVVLEVLGGDNVSVIEGLPGSGKTATMREVVRQYRKAGYRVSGCAVSSSAARELSSSAGIRAVNITKLRYELDKHAKREFALNLSMDYYKESREGGDGIIDTALYKAKLTSKDVLIVDESSMVDLTEMHYLLNEVKKGGAKLILVGDSNQLPSVGTQGAAEKMAEMFGVSRLNEVRRQSLDEHRQATELLSEFKVAQAVELYRKTGVFGFSESIDKAKNALVTDYVNEYLGLLNETQKPNKKRNGNNDQIISSRIVALAYTNKDISELNTEIRSKLVDSGAIAGKARSFEISREGERATIALAKGDQVVFTRNSQYLGVSNSDTGEVIGFSSSKDGKRGTLLIRVSAGSNVGGIIDSIVTLGSKTRIVEVDNFYFKGLDYGYAVNVYKSQGKTYESVKGLIDAYTGYNTFNVMATRHKDRLKLYAGSDVLNNELYRKISLSTEQAKNDYEIRSSHKDQDSARYAGLVALIQKRGDTSLATDHQQSINGKLLEETNTVARYVEVRGEVIKVRQATDDWLELERAKGRIRQHHDSPYHEELKPLLTERQNLASVITDNYEDYGKLLSRCKLNYNTIEKHAGKSEHHYYFKRIDYSGSIKDIDGFSRILDLQEQISGYSEGKLFEAKLNDHRKELKEITSRIIDGFEDHKLAIHESRTALNEALESKHKAECYVEDGKKYIKSGFLKYLGQTFKEDAQHHILKNWEQLKSEKSKDGALEVVKADPTILGKLKGIGLGNFVALSGDRMRAQENVEILPQKLEKYEEYRDKLPEIEKLIEKGEYGKDIINSELTLKSLEAKLPNRGAQEFIEQANKVSKVQNSRELLAWARDAKVQAQSTRYREFLGSKNQSLSNHHEYKEKNTKEYIAERESLLKQYEYSRGNDDRSKLYRYIAGSVDPDLAYDILKNIYFKGIDTHTTDEIKAQFILVSNHLPASRIDQVQKELLQAVQYSISYKVNEVQIMTEKDHKLSNIRSEIIQDLKSTFNAKFDLDVSSAKHQQIISKSEEYIFEHLAIYHKEPDIFLRERIIERAIYEVENKPGWTLALERYYMDDGQKDERYTLSAGEKILIDKQADRLVSIESRLIEEHTKQNKTINRHVIERETKQIEATRDDRVDAMLHDNKHVITLAKVDKDAGKNMAEQLVDFGFKYGDGNLADIPNNYFNTLKNIALEQSKIAKEVVTDFEKANDINSTNNKEHRSDYKEDKVFTADIIDKDRQGIAELVKHDMYKSLTREAAITKAESVDVSKAQAMKTEHTKFALDNLKTMQKQFEQERKLEIKNNRELEISRSRGMSIDK